jgi:hypothetical protein
MATKKGKAHYSKKKGQKGRWMYPDGAKSKRYWKRS